MTQRIIFLDIDGPVIDTPCYFVDSMASLQRSVMNTGAIGWLNRLAQLSGALIVTNSTHNNFTVKETGRTLLDDLIKWGLKRDFIHENWRTDFPWPANHDRSVHRRLQGIMNWQQDNGQADWIAFDDEPFLDPSDGRLMHVDFDRGINYDLFMKACAHWDINPRSMIL